MVTVPVRAVEPVLATTSMMTGALPIELAPVITVIHGALLVAVQAHARFDAVTFTDVVVAVAATVAPDDESVYVHDTPAWVTLNGCPAIVSVPLRDVVAVCAATA